MVGNADVLAEGIYAPAAELAYPINEARLLVQGLTKAFFPHENLWPWC